MICQKDLSLMRKLLTGIVAEDIYEYLEEERILPDKQKGCHRKSCGTKDQLLIDKAILKDRKRRKTNLAMAIIAKLMILSPIVGSLNAWTCLE